MSTFLNIPQKVDHGLLLAARLAERFADKTPLPLEEIARKEGISHGYLEEVARLLRAAGMIEGKRGAGGGYVLAKDPNEISVADVIAAIEGRGWFAECLGEHGHAAKVRASSNRDVWRKVQGQFMASLYGMTVAQVAADVRDKDV
jgi:Rrf2 family protein